MTLYLTWWTKFPDNLAMWFYFKRWFNGSRTLKKTDLSLIEKKQLTRKKSP